VYVESSVYVESTVYKLCTLSVCLCPVDRNTRIDNLQKHVCDLITQRETLQFEETQLHQQYAQVCAVNV